VAKVRRAKERPSIFTPEQVEAIQENVRGIVENTVAVALRCSQVAYEMAMALEYNTPNLRERLKPIMALVKTGNAAFFLTVKLEPSLLHAAAVESDNPPVQPLATTPPLVLACLSPLARVG
jgi:hypothetical protein